MLLIGQLNYTTTPRYNFPQSLELEVPQRFIELSVNSMRSVMGGYLQVSTDVGEVIGGRSGEDENALPLNPKIITAHLTTLKPVRDGTPIIAIDVSSVKIGETERGILCAIRGAIVWNERGKYGYLRVGPFPFHITEENKREMVELARFHHPSMAASLLRLADVQDRLSKLMERWLQMSICCSSYGSIILWDGSLTAGTPDTPVSLLTRLLEIARRNGNSILAFSKVTNVRLLGRRITDLIWKYPPPCVLRLDDLTTLMKGQIRVMGNVYVVKLCRGGLPFRLDVDGGIPHSQGVLAIERILGNEILYQGYPETLRLAHILSTFTASEVIGIQRFIAERYNLKVIVRPSVRRMLFGPFGTRFED